MTSVSVLIRAVSVGVVAAVASGTAQSALTSREPGIYIEIDAKMTQVSSSVVAKARPAGVMANAATLGFKGIDVKATIEGAESEVRVKSTTPEFLFHGDSFKPSDYLLVQLDAKDDHREVKTGKVGLLGRVKSEVDKDALIKVKVSKIEDGLWKLVPEKVLKPGEYAFVIAAALSERVWSFGVD